MRRYNCTVGDKRGEFGDCMEKKQDGLWVRHSQAQAAIDRLNSEINRLKLLVKNGRKS